MTTGTEEGFLKRKGEDRFKHRAEGTRPSRHKSARPVE